MKMGAMHKMEKFLTDVLGAFGDKANLAGAAVVAFAVDRLGAGGPVFGFFLFLECVDFWYGIKKARRTGTYSSAKGAEGALKKVSYWVVIGIAFWMAEILRSIGAQMSIDLGFLQMLGWFTLGVYILNELTSIVENLVVLGIDVPPIFVRGLAAARNALDEAGNKILPMEAEREGENKNG